MGHSAADDFMNNIQRGRDAADEAAALRAEIDRLRAALHKIAEHPDTPELIRQYAVSQQTPPIPQK